ncbi:glycosyltransferase [Polynucleobacter sp. 80A-SIGWE]|uniref:glycosyltransferase n=1 Tax=Polynucleobacter sp. 80A-SIGWE TaxID=2689100 RepID=UPI001C0E4F0E|nr:glycosyltransferase [Polynucleobacter sp. 80A-SIGWE]MBU3589416.1 hypothetical protein [Polynucleobacter sp. 80A-SIGWE]
MITNDELPVRVVCATKLDQNDFLSKTHTGRSIRAFIETSKVEVRLYASNSKGLGELYNKAIEEALLKPAILVFIHDDVLLCDYFWVDRVREGLKRFELLGVVGNTRRLPRQPGWIMTNTEGNLDDKKYLSGAIGQGNSYPPLRLDVFGAPGLECKLMDGVFLAISSKTIEKSKLRFDSRFNFHFYDLDFCRSAEMLNVKMGTIPLSIVHASYGGLDKSWFESYATYIDKWKE